MTVAYKPHPYQAYATRRIVESEKVALFLDMGLGKTVATLTAIQELKEKGLNRALVIAPLRVAKYTWPEELAKWNHLDMTMSVAVGSLKDRVAALKRKADIYVINRENVPWLVDVLKGRWPFDLTVIDESSSFKNPQAKRFKALRSVHGAMERLVLLTGTPAPNGYMDLWPQIYLLDSGQRLGRTLTAYREHFFVPGRRNGHIVYDWVLKDGADEGIETAISDICVSMTAEDWLDLPERVDNMVRVDLPTEARLTYDRLKKDMLDRLDGEVVTAANAAVLSNKLLQVASGAVYSEDGNVVEVHEAKLDALAELAESGQPMLVFYAYRHDLDRLRKRFPKAKTIDEPGALERWNKGQLDMLLLHPASAGHGLNLQSGGHIVVWFSLTWSLELYQQANARLHRQGQQHGVIVHHLIARGTMDERVLKALEQKEMGQDALIDAVKAELEG